MVRLSPTTASTFSPARIKPRAPETSMLSGVPASREAVAVQDASGVPAGALRAAMRCPLR